MKNCTKSILYALTFVLSGATVIATSTESAPRARGEDFPNEPGYYTTYEEKPLTSEITPECEDEEKSVPKSAVPTSEPSRCYALTGEERAAIERMVASEGGYCEYRFQALVALCILNGCEADNLRPLELFARGDFWLTHNVAPTETTKQAVSDVFDEGVMPTVEPIRYYYNPNFCSSAAHESKTYVLTCCECRFFKD